MNQKTGICSDFKSVLEGIKRNDRNNNTSYSEKYKSLIPFSFAYKVVCIDDKFNKPVILNRRKKAVNKFMDMVIYDVNLKGEGRCIIWFISLHYPDYRAS